MREGGRDGDWEAVADEIFKREVIDGREFVFRPMSLYDSAQVGRGSTEATFEFPGRAGTTDRHLDELDEPALDASAIHLPQTRELMLKAFGLAEPAWALLAARLSTVPERAP